MKCKWIIGAGAPLEMAYDICRQIHPDLHTEKITISQNTNYTFNLDALDTLQPESGTAFVAFDERFGNFKRMELMAAVMERGLSLPPLISPRAMLSSGVKIGPNSLVGDGTIVGYGCRIDYNSVILPGVHIGHSTHIRPSCWLETGVSVGNNIQIGAHCTLRNGAILAHGIKIGRSCELGWPQRYAKDISAKTIFDNRYDSPIHTYGN
ncbi:UDP-3-O-(3-hydroxymyristoyl)glucosamine N-acyltransferase [Comamonas sp. C24C]